MVPALVTEDTVLAAAAPGAFPLVAFEIARRLHGVPQQIEPGAIDVVTSTAWQVADVVRVLRRRDLVMATADGMVVDGLTPAGASAAERLPRSA
jgi:hypothetical protein